MSAADYLDLLDAREAWVAGVTSASPAMTR